MAVAMLILRANVDEGLEEEVLAAGEVVRNLESRTETRRHAPAAEKG
jgi:hypothetical protein